MSKPSKSVERRLAIQRRDTVSAPAEPRYPCCNDPNPHSHGFGSADLAKVPAEPLTDPMEQRVALRMIETLQAERDSLSAQLVTQQAEDDKIRALCRDAGMTDESTTLDYLHGVFYMLKKLATQQAAHDEFVRSLRRAYDHLEDSPKSFRYSVARLLGVEPGETK